MNGLLIFIAVLFFSISIRVILGYPIRRPKIDNLDYQSTWVSGYPAFGRGLWAAQNCMWVHVTANNVAVRVHFPFSIFLVPEFLGIGWAFSKEKLISCSKTLMGVRVRYKGLFFEREFVVHVGDKNRFIEAIKNA